MLSRDARKVAVTVILAQHAARFAVSDPLSPTT